MSRRTKQDIIEELREEVSDLEDEVKEHENRISDLEDELEAAENFKPEDHGYISEDDAWDEIAQVITAFRKGDREEAEILIARYAPKSIIYGG